MKSLHADGLFILIFDQQKPTEQLGFTHITNRVENRGNKYAPYLFWHEFIKSQLGWAGDESITDCREKSVRACFVIFGLFVYLFFRMT